MPDIEKLHQAFMLGDFAAIEHELGDCPGFPNSILSTELLGFASFCLEAAIYHSPLSFIKLLLEEKGVLPDYPAQNGFPSLITALSTNRPDKYELVELLLKNGADVQQRGINDYTPLHWAAAYLDVPMMQLLLSYGADPNARTRIDEYATPLEEIERAHKKNDSENAKFLRNFASNAQ